MNKKAIKKTAVIYWCEDDQCFLKESPLFDSVLGVGDTPEEAENAFSDLLDDAYDAYLDGRVPGYTKPGRPAKGGVALNSDVRPETKERVKELAQQFDCSTGEVVDYLLFCLENSEGIAKTRQFSMSKESKLEELSNRITALEHLQQTQSTNSKSKKPKPPRTVA